MNVLQTAQWWKQLGISTIPIVYGSKQPRVRWLLYTERLPEDNELQNWYTGESNIAIVTGWNDLVILDFDDADKLNAWRSWADDELRIRHNAAPSTVYRNTRIHHSARGYHVFVFCEKAENMKLPKLDVLAERKYALIPPSLHPSGANYEVYQSGLPMRIKSLYDVLPKKLLDTAYAAKAPKSAQPAPIIPSGPDPLLVPNDTDMWTVMGTAYDDQPHAVAEIKKRWKIEQMFPGAIRSGGNGRWLLTLCPFHDDHNPSFWIDTEHQLCGCHSGCTPLPLDVIGLYARLHNVDNTTAIREMAAHL